MSHLKGKDGVRWGVTQCDRGGGGSSATCDVTLAIFYNTFIVINNLLGFDQRLQIHLFTYSNY